MHIIRIIVTKKVLMEEKFMQKNLSGFNVKDSFGRNFLSDKKKKFTENEKCLSAFSLMCFFFGTL